MIERAVTLCTSPVISAEEFRDHLQPRRLLRHGRRAVSARDAARGERDTILRALEQAGGNQTRAAQALGIGRNTLWRKMKKYGIESHR